MKKRVAILFLTAGLVSGVLTSCSVFDKQEQIEDWEYQRHSAFQAFRDQRYIDAIDRYKLALEKAKAIGANDHRVALTMNDIARAYAETNDFSSAAEWYQKAIYVVKNGGGPRDMGNTIPLCEAFEGLANAKAELGAGAECDHYYQEALKLAREYNLPRLRNIVYEFKAHLIKEGNAAQAQSLAQDQQEISSQQALPDQLASRKEELKTAMHAGDAARDKGTYDAAAKAYVQALNVAHDIGDEESVIASASHLAYSYKHLGMWSQAERYQRFAVQKAQQIQSKQFAVELCGLAELLRDEKKYGEAMAAALTAVQITQQHASPSQVELMPALTTVISIGTASQQWDEAIAAQQRAYDIAKRQAPIASPLVIMPACYVVNLCYMAKQPERGNAFLEDYLKELRKRPASELVLAARLLNDFGDVCSKSQRGATAKRFYTAALELTKSIPDEHEQTARAKERIGHLATGSG